MLSLESNLDFLLWFTELGFPTSATSLPVFSPLPDVYQLPSISHLRDRLWTCCSSAANALPSVLGISASFSPSTSQFKCHLPRNFFFLITLFKYDPITLPYCHYLLSQHPFYFLYGTFKNLFYSFNLLTF